MSEKPKEKSPGTLVGVVLLLLLLLLPVLYFLSIGPAIYLYRDDPEARQALLLSFYYPLLYLEGRSHTFNVVLQWYVDWWQ